MTKSNHLEEGLLNHVFRGVDFPTLGTNVFVSLHTADPTDAGSGAEVSGGSYARVAVLRDADSWSAPTQVTGLAEIANSNDIEFPTPSANWGQVTHFGVWTASSGGNLLYHGALTTPKTINNGDPAPKFSAGDLKIRES